jgi:hypothetical protein
LVVAVWEAEAEESERVRQAHVAGGVGPGEVDGGEGV